MFLMMMLRLYSTYRPWVSRVAGPSMTISVRLAIMMLLVRTMGAVDFIRILVWLLMSCCNYCCEVATTY